MADITPQKVAPSQLYAERDVDAQGVCYLNHLHAMTHEGLHKKAAIAAELAHRDILIAEQAAEIERLRGLTQWRPIETAPRDGTDILVRMRSGARLLVVYWDAESKAPRHHWHTIDGPIFYSDFAFDGWMPAPPTQEDAP